MKTSTQITDLLNAAGCYPDKVSRKGDTYSVRRSYFYRPGSSRGSPFASMIRAIATIPGAQVVDQLDEWRAWPKTSYFRVDFKIVAPAPASETTPALVAEPAPAFIAEGI